MNNFSQRTLTGAAYVILVTVSLILHPAIFAVLTAFMNFLGLYEFRKMDRCLSKVSPAWIFFSTALMLAAALLTAFRPGSPFLPAAVLIIVTGLLIYSLYLKNQENADFLFRSIFSVVYITLPLLLLNMIHFHPLVPEISIVLPLFILIWVNDSFAYIFGLLLGKHRLFERISPKKSWEGFFGGLAMSLAASLILYRLLPSLSLYHWMVFGLLTVLASVFGDFVESLLKRSANVKDSGTILPGHGGILDRIDSLLLAGPVIYIYLLTLNTL